MQNVECSTGGHLLASFGWAICLFELRYLKWLFIFFFDKQAAGCELKTANCKLQTETYQSFDCFFLAPAFRNFSCTFCSSWSMISKSLAASSLLKSLLCSCFCLEDWL